MSRQSFDSEEVSVESEEEDERTTPVEEEGSAEEDAKPISFPLTEEEEVDTTAEQAAAGRDLQGIPWERLQFSREHYRKTRVISYRNYVNVIPDDPVEFRLEYRPELLKLCTPVAYVGNGVQPWQGQEGQLWSKGRPTRPAYFNFVRNNRAVQSNIVHFQLRNLVFAASRNDVFYVHQNSIYHWSPVSRLRTEVLRLSGSGRRSVPRLGRVQVSTMSQMGNLVAAGGFNGELACYRLQNEGELIFAEHITNSENGITNGLELFNSQQHDVCLVASNNDQAVRVYQAMPSGLRLTNRWDYDWAVNYTTAQPGSSVLAVVGDDPVTFLTDMRQRENRVCTLNAHADFSFAAAWHPAGHLLATGNQDTTTCVWDVRQPNSPMARMAGNMGAIRSLRFSADGKFLAASEPADFVHIYDVAADFKRAQLVDLFGEISGISFTPFAEELFIGVADLTYSSVLQYERAPPVQLPTDVPMQWDGVKQEADRQENMAVESEEPEDAETVKFQMMQRSLAAAEEAEDREVQEQEVELQRLIERHADEQEQLLLEEQQPLLQAEPHAGRGQEGAVEQQQQQQQGVDEAGPSGVGHQLNQTINDIQLDQESEDTDEDEEEARFSSWLKDRSYVHRKMPPTQFYNLVEVEEQARQVMEKQSYDYISGGSGSLYTINENLASFSRLKLVPRLLRDVSRVDMSCNILGVQSSMPVWIAPMAMHGLCHPDREMGTARAAAAAGVPYTFSTVATSSMQEIASTGHPNPVFQLYVIRDRGVVEAWVRTAEKLGFKALMVTVDAQRLGYREADERNRFTLPAHLQLKNLELLRNRTRTSQARDSEAGSGLTQLFAKEVDDTLTWDFVPWLRSITRLPIIVKGLLAAEDVELALAAGVNGIAVSNHGGRQLDCSPSALEVLPAIVKAVNKRVPVFMDGGIRRGTDVLKALALGADCVLLGRPVLYGLALAGQEGVGRVISLLRNELELSMALAGCPSLAHISPHLILPPQPHPRDLLLGPATHTNNPTGSSSGGSSSSTGMQRASCAAHTDSPVCSSSSSSGSSSTGVQRADCAACTSGSACSTCSCSGGSRSTMGMGGPGVAAISRNSTSQLGGGFGGACGGSRAVCCECECSNSCGGGGSGAQTLMGQGRGVASRL